MLSSNIQRLLTAQAVTPEIRAAVEANRFEYARKLIRKEGGALADQIRISGQGLFSFECFISEKEKTEINQGVYDLQQLYNALTKQGA